MLGLAGVLSIGWAVVLAAFGLGVAAMMPTGGRAAALSLMLWSAVLLVSLGGLIDDGPGRAGYALAAGLVFALLSAAALWATGRAGRASEVLNGGADE
jgi:hypothetical protein